MKFTTLYIYSDLGGAALDKLKYTYKSTKMSVTLITVLASIGVGILILVGAVFLAVTAYIYYAHRKFAHLPTPKYSR